MNTKSTEATPSVVASLQTSAKDFNFQNILESVKASKEPITKSVLDDLLSKHDVHEDSYEFESCPSKVEPTELDKHINRLIDILQKDYSDKPGTIRIIGDLTRSKSEEDADSMFNEFVRQCEASDLFREGVMYLQEAVKNKGIVHNSLLEEAHYLFMEEEPKNPYEKELNELNAYIESEKEKVWKALKVGSYYDNRVAITKKTKKYVTVEYGDKSRRFCKDDMLIFNRQGICSYFNLWDEESLGCFGDCLSTLFCTDKQDILEYLDKYDEPVKDECLQLLWNSRPTYAKNSSCYEFITNLKTFDKEYGYSTLSGLDCIESFSISKIAEAKMNKLTFFEIKEAINDAIYSTNWTEINPKAYNDMLKDIPVVDMRNLTDNDLNAIERKYNDLKKEPSLEKKFFSEESAKAEAVLEFFQKKRGK